MTQVLQSDQNLNRKEIADQVGLNIIEKISLLEMILQKLLIEINLEEIQLDEPSDNEKFGRQISHINNFTTSKQKYFEQPIKLKLRLNNSNDISVSAPKKEHNRVKSESNHERKFIFTNEKPNFIAKHIKEYQNHRVKFNKIFTFVRNGKQQTYFQVNLDIPPDVDTDQEVNYIQQEITQNTPSSYFKLKNEKIDINMMSLIQGINLSQSWKTSINFTDPDKQNILLAVLQAHFIRHFYFNFRKKYDNFSELLKQDNQGYIIRNCLIASVASLLFKIASNNTVKLVYLKRVNNQFNNAQLHIPIPIQNCNIVQIKFKNYLELYSELQKYQSMVLQDDQFGLNLFLYTIILSKGLLQLHQEFDSNSNLLKLQKNQGCCLINQQGVGTQELNNLLLTGRATSNSFNGDKKLDDNFIMKGVTQQSEFGFLSQLESKKWIEIGSYYKEPIVPVWIVYLNKSYGVIAGWHKDIIIQRVKEFDLLYFSGFTIQPLEKLKVNLSTNQNAVQTNNLWAMVLSTKWGKNIQIESIQFE